MIALLTARRSRTENVLVMRRLLTLLICLTAWATLGSLVERTEVPPPRAAAPTSGSDTATPQPDGHTNDQWISGSLAIASFTESRWTPSAAYATLASAPSGCAIVETRTVRCSDRSVRARSAHLLHIPLLI